MAVRPKSDMLAPNKVLELSEFSLPSDNTTKEERTTATTTESLASRVARHPVLAGMDQKQLALLTDSAMAVEFKKGEVIFREGELADRFFLFEPGKVIIRKSSAGPRDPMSGWLGISPPHTWNCTASAVEPSTAIFFYKTLLREYCEKDHSLGYELLKRFSLLMYQRAQAIRNKMLTHSLSHG
jgi:CRP/FNR family cyclic AMP-dependent transcriptional regulator